MQQFYFLLLFISAQLTYGQTFIGTVYGGKSTLGGVVVKNARTSRITTTDSEGVLTMQAQVGDSLSFQFFTYEDKWLVLDEKDTTNFVVELIPKVNLLDEVLLEADPTFKEETFTKTFTSDIKTDIERYPEKYEYNNNPNGNLDFVRIGRALWKLITKNKPPKVIPPPKVAITLDQYLVLFKEDRVINHTFLIETLKIPLNKKALFIDFCISQHLDNTLLEEKNKFVLIDKLVNLGREFLDRQ